MLLLSGTMNFWCRNTLSNAKHKCFRILASFIAITASHYSNSQVIISEYLEGASFNKCIELFNNSGSSVDLSTYTIQVYFNGNTSAGSTIALSGTLLSCETYVVCHTSANAGLLGVSDQTSGSLSFNGNDAVALFNGATMLDLFGNIGEDPGSEWTGVGNGTENEGVVRNASYCAGVTTDPSGSGFPAFTTTNWTAVGQVGGDLGSHTNSCPSCSGNTITTGAVNTAPFDVECATPITASGTVDFTSSGTFNGGNIYTAELSDASGSFASPTSIGTLTSTANSGTINITIPSTMDQGTCRWKTSSISCRSQGILLAFVSSQ